MLAPKKTAEPAQAITLYNRQGFQSSACQNSMQSSSGREKKTAEKKTW